MKQITELLFADNMVGGNRDGFAIQKINRAEYEIKEYYNIQINIIKTHNETGVDNKAICP